MAILSPEQITEEIKKYTAGALPEAYIYAIQVNMPFWVYILLATGLIGLLWVKPRIIALKSNQLLMVGVNLGINKFTGEFTILKPGDVQNVSYKKFGLAHYITIHKNDGSKLRLIANHKVRKFTNQQESLEKIKKALGVNA
jgi:hypothetical protein